MIDQKKYIDFIEMLTQTLKKKVKKPNSQYYLYSTKLGEDSNWGNIFL